MLILLYFNLRTHQVLPTFPKVSYPSNTIKYISVFSIRIISTSIDICMYIVVYYFFLKLQLISVALCSFPIAFDFWVIICIRYHEYNYTKQQKVTHREFVTRSCWVALMPDGLLFIQIKTEFHLHGKKSRNIFRQIDGNFVMG